MERWLAGRDKIATQRLTTDQAAGRAVLATMQGGSLLRELLAHVIVTGGQLEWAARVAAAAVLGGQLRADVALSAFRAAGRHFGRYSAVSLELALAPLVQAAA